MFPREIYRLISLKLSPGTLAINQELNSIYDDTWYEDHLRLQCPGVTDLWKQTSYKDRYIKFLQSGQISKKEGYIGWGTTAAAVVDYSDGKDHDMILNFNGDLFMDGVVIATKVISIDTNTYVTQYEWYYYKWGWTRVNLIPPSPFLSVNYSQPYIYSFTETGIYCYVSCLQIQYLSYLGIKNMIINNDEIYVLNNKGEVYIFAIPYDLDWIKKQPLGLLVCRNVSQLYKGRGLKMQDGTSKLISSNLSIKEIPLTNITSIASDSPDIFLVCNNEVYCCYRKGTGYWLNSVPIVNKVKRVIDDWIGIYLVWEGEALSIDLKTIDSNKLININLS